MEEEKFAITILGARGSIPVSGREFSKYGGESSSYMVEIGDLAIFLDAGTGIINAPGIEDEKKVIIILSHSHIDHICGLTFFPELSKKGRSIELYGRCYNGISIASQIESAFLEPYWPLTISEYPADLIYKDLNVPLELRTGEEKILVEGLPVNHPGGCLALSITYKDKKLVYISDCEMGSSPEKELIDFSEGASLLLCDAQYTEEEYENRKGYGHSTAKKAISLMESAGAEKMILIHHDPRHDDNMLDEMEKKLNRKDICFAKNGMRIDLL